MRLFPGVAAEVGRQEEARATGPRPAPAAPRYARTLAEAAAVVDALRGEALSAIALDTEYAYVRPAVPTRDGGEWRDIRAIRPVCLSLAASNGAVAVVDLRTPGVAAVVDELLRLPVRFVFHHAKSELFCLWALGLDPELRNFHDTHLAAACLLLGAFHPSGGGEPRDLERRRRHALSLVGLCAHYGLGYPHSEAKDELRREFAGLADDAPLTTRLVEYAAADAVWTLKLYGAQQADVCSAGLQRHLESVEFPFAVVNARMEWNGVQIDRERLQRVREGLRGVVDRLASRLRELGVDPPGDEVAFRRALAAAAVDGLFVRDGAFSTSDGRLKDLEHVHPAVRLFRLHRRYVRLRVEAWSLGVDGRLHPCHVQLGAATGRNACREPNLPGVGRALRPLVVAPPGRALVELDYAQIEVGVAAAEFEDAELIASFNRGDVYVEAAKRFYAAELTDEERSLDAEEFKRRRPELREAMKVFVLAVINNMHPGGLAARFDLSVADAERERDRFLALYPRLRDGLTQAERDGARRGFAPIVGGLRRGLYGASGRRAANLLRNTPLQGGAAVVFKRALLELDRAFRGSPTRLVLPVHDAVLLECDAHAAEEVAWLAADLMSLALKSVYPQLDGRVTWDLSDTSCWHAGGGAASLEALLSEPGAAS